MRATETAMTSGPTADTPAGRRPRVLFVCAHNAGRSALAVALARHRAADRIEADSAGTTPDPEPSASTIATLAELGIDASTHRPTAITAERVAAANVVVAMKPGLDLPHAVGVRYETWRLSDPAGWDTEGIRPLRDEIDRRVQALIADLTGTPSVPESS
ncbi:arsenate-mycothiol transferase ArsC [Blastococcus sp. SYSU DS0973]